MKKLTKRERKSLRGHNAAMKRSFRDGALIKMSDRDYYGRSPVYHVNKLTGALQKTLAGIPFVRLY